MSSFNANAGDTSATGGAPAQGGFNSTNTNDPGKQVEPQVDYSKLQKRFEDSQNFIEQLKRERQEDRRLIEELQSKPAYSLEQIQELINKSRAEGNDNSPDPEVLVKQVTERVNQTLTQKEVAQKEQANFNEVTQVLAAHYGQEIDAKVAEIAGEVGLSVAEVVALSKKNPKAVYKLLGISDKARPATPSRTSVNTAGLATPPPPRQPSIMKVKTERERMSLVADRLSAHIKNQR